MGHFLEKAEDFEFAGKSVLASRLGYRITLGFTATFFGRVFSAEDRGATSDMIRT